MIRASEEETYRGAVLDKLNAIKEDVAETRIQATKTNGRVGALEVNSHKQDVKIAIMATAIATAVAIKFPFVAKILSSL